MTDLDEMLRRYLQREEEDPIRKRLERTAEWQIEHDQKDEHRHGEVVRALDGHNFRLQTLEQKAVKLAEDVEDTGEHRLEALQAALNEAKGQIQSTHTERRNFWIGVGSAVIGGVIVAMIAAHFGIHP